MNGFCTFDIARAPSCPVFRMVVIVVVGSKAGLTEPDMPSGMGMGTGFEGDTRFDTGLLGLLL